MSSLAGTGNQMGRAASVLNCWALSSPFTKKKKTNNKKTKQKRGGGMYVCTSVSVFWPMKARMDVKSLELGFQAFVSCWRDNITLVLWKSSSWLSFCWFVFVSLIQGRVIWRERTPVGKMSLPDCPVGGQACAVFSWLMINMGRPDPLRGVTCWMVLADEMVQLGRVLVPCYLSLVRGPHIRKERSDTRKLSLISARMLWRSSPHTCTVYGIRN